MVRLGVGVLTILLAAAGPPTATAQTWDVTQPRGATREIAFQTDEGTWMSVDVSPDGRWIVFDLLGHVYRVPIDGGEARLLTGGSGIAVNYHPRIAPDGRTIAFVSDRGGQDNLWLMDADGGNPRPLHNDLQYRVMEPRWTPDGMRILATQQLPTEVGFYRTVDVISAWPAAGGPPEALVTLGASGASTPSRAGVWAGNDRAQWASPSPDGRYVYFHSSLFSGEFRHLRRFDRGSGTIDNVTEPKGRYLHCCGRPAYPLRLGEVAPEVSPDGRRLAFVRKLPGGVTRFRGHDLTGRSALWLRDLETGAERILMDPVTNAAIDQHPSWNAGVLPGYSWIPDGTALVIAQGGRIRRVDVATGEVATIPFTAQVDRTISEMARGTVSLADDRFQARYLRWPTSSPDGSRVIVEAGGWLWLVGKGAGVMPRRLIEPERWMSPSLDGSAAASAHPADLPLELMPAWSPGGAQVAFVTWDEVEGGHVWRVDSDGGVPQRLSRVPGRYAHPLWTGDGESILVNEWDPALDFAPGTRGWRLLRLDLEGGTGVMVAEGGALRRMARDRAGDILYSAPGTEGRGVFSLSLDAGEERVLAWTPAIARHAALSPDGRWAALDIRKDIYLVPVDGVSAGVGPAILDPETTPGTQRLTLRGGTHPRWRDDGTLEYAAPGRHIAYDPVRGVADSTRIELAIPRPVPTGSVALIGGRIITMVGNEVIDAGTVLVRGSRIDCIGSCDVAGADRVVDVTGTTITPGWVDVHAHHLGLTAAELIDRRRSESARYLVYGVTTTHDPASVPEPSFSIGEYTAAGRIVGPRTFSTGQQVTCGDPAWSDLRPIVTLDDARDHVNRLADQGALSIKDYKQCTRIQRQMLAEAARERRITLTSENGNLMYVLGLIMGGHTGWEHPLQYVPTYSDVTRFLGQAGAFYSADLILSDYPHGNALEHWLGQDDLWSNPVERSWSPWQELAARRSFVKRPPREFMFPILAEAAADLVRQGGQVPVGAHGELDGLGTHWEVWTLAAAMTPLEALRSATVHGARFLGLEDEIGTLEAGKMADLVVLNANPLDDVRSTTDIRLVMVDGNLYDASDLRQLWPLERPYGPHPWTNDEILRDDTRGDDYWNRRDP